MKRIKIMLSAIAVLAIVGGAFAFKAQKFTATAVYCSALDAQQNPTCTLPGFQRANNGLTPTSTIPCGAGVQYYNTSIDKCTINGVTPANNKTLYPTTVE
jgi:hypothetical protein